MATATAPAPVIPAPLATIADLAAETGIPANTWRQWAREGKGPRPRKLGGRWFYDRAVVAAWIADQDQQTP
ncbi:helix-turn-helix domain-containing protein [Mycobacteroides immunogenum]|uniref:helix-turn-helix transcriptional regulator n=1 Tax=Mycobacteroides immunogenum TaxID=83262 RepID=UPI0025B75AE2|nr:helix-turn-helix domain-containing protein [Mycobacteroides immunogenum]WJR35271.1 helix-turn-helix domain-containing protein [Mycobacteroides immunogenum]